MEKNQLMVLMSILQLMDGERNGGIDGPKLSAMLEDWDKRGNMTKEEHKYLKLANTYLSKFCASVMDRLNPKEREERPLSEIRDWRPHETSNPSARVHQAAILQT